MDRNGDSESELDASEAAAAGRITVDLLTTVIGGESRLDAQTIRLLQIKSFIDENFADPTLSVELIATASAVSTRYVFRLFQESGETCREYIARQRLCRARRLLMDTDLTVTAIAHGCVVRQPLGLQPGVPPSGRSVSSWGTD